jgi:hypothetical protein
VSVGRCRNCFHFSSGEGRIKGGEDFCCFSLTANCLKRDYPGIFKPDTRFPPSQTDFIDWAEKDMGCDFFKQKVHPAEVYSA